jgi:hypothetical protein
MICKMRSLGSQWLCQHDLLVRRASEGSRFGVPYNSCARPANPAREVDNKISTLPVSVFDNQLRATIAGRIYRDPLFWNYPPR